jgi:hypothetical protein
MYDMAIAGAFKSAQTILAHASLTSRLHFYRPSQQLSDCVSRRRKESLSLGFHSIIGFFGATATKKRSAAPWKMQV